MALFLHIIIAFSSLAFTTYMMFRPSEHKLYASYGLVAATLITGTMLVMANPSHMVQACTSGLIYVGAVTVGILATRRKLAHDHVD